MNKIRLNIDDREVLGLPGQTILEVAKENNIFIPTLCYDERAEIYGSCGICVVEVEGSPKLFKACATEIAQNMIIKTDTERVRESRKTNLELLLSNHNGDCKAPCSLGCPANTDCQGYVGLIANGLHKAALKLVKDKIPLPASIGRVCPHHCESDCRRGLVEESISIKELKRFVGDRDLNSDNPYIPEISKPTGKSVAIIGGGPAGLSASYFLAQKGHDVTIIDAMPKLGGMLRYGIPEYRLPKEILQKEIDLIAKMGVKMQTNTKVGVDLSFEAIKNKYDAVLMTIGAWSSIGLNCKGSDIPGVMGGIDFLEKIAKSKTINLGESVAVVGGGNVAMDACRTAVRMGAKKVYNIYRRTIKEMPADEMEIREAQEEGVRFENLTNPIGIIPGEDGRVSKIELQVMKLGEPDERGRRRPVPVEGQTKVLDVDTVIIAIGQQVDSKLFDGIEKTRKNSLVYDPSTYMTATKGVFACGDCGNDKVSIAVESIADAKKAAESIDAYLYGKELKYKKPYVHERHDLTELSFEDRERKYRPKIKEYGPKERKEHFLEITEGLTEKQAKDEARRCLECGCQKFHECKLIDYANIYKVEPERFEGEKVILPIEDSHPYILRDMNKCILCGLCVRTCDEVMGVGALGLVSRGFDTEVKPALEQGLEETSCISCGQCVSVCPTGALQEKTNLKKNVPLQKETTVTTCSYCSVGCKIELKTYGNLLIKSEPNKEGHVNEGLICGRGKWAFDSAIDDDRLKKPYIKINGKLEECKYRDALTIIAKKVEVIRSKFGKDAVAISISDRYTNEEAYAIKKLADQLNVKTLCFNHRKSGLEKVLGVNASPNSMDELLATDVILAIGFKPENNPILGIKLKKAAKNGAKLLFINPSEYKISNYGFDAKTVYTSNEISKIKEIAKALIDMGKTSDIEGFDAFKSSLENIEVSDEIREIAQIYADAKKAMIVFQQNMVSTDIASLIGEIAILSGHIGSPRDGILQVKPKCNSQGLIDLGVTDGREALNGVKGLLCFGEDPDVDLSSLEFLMVSDTHMTKTALSADVVLPATSFASTFGTFTNTERRLQRVSPAMRENVEVPNWKIPTILSKIYEKDFGFKCIDDIRLELNDVNELYREGNVGQLLGGILKPNKPKFVYIPDGLMVTPLKSTDNLMNKINEEIFKGLI